MADTGYHFVDWSDGSTNNPRTDSNLSGGLSVTANFAINTYDLNYTAGSNGTLTGETSQTVNYGESGTAVTAVPNTGFNFIKWSDGSVENPRTDTNENINVTASFGIDRYALTYVAGPNGALTGSKTQLLDSEEDGTAVTAVPNTGYIFVDWSDSSTENPRTDTEVTESIYVTANFSKDTYTLEYAANSNGSLSGTTTQTVEYQSDGTAVTAVPDSGYHFLNWNDGSVDNPRTDLEVSENISVTANFEENRTATTIYVNSSTGNDTTGAGTSGNPYKTFYKGYTMSAPGDILDLTGTFTWSDDAEIGDMPVKGYVITKNITIQGQGADTTIVQAAFYDNTANRRVFTIASGATVTIQNLSIRYGRVSGYNNDGGGIRNEGTTTITDCQIYNNRSTADSGGGISNRHTLTISNSSIYNNIAYYMGGGIVNSYYIDSSGYLTITNSTIAYNQQTTAIAYMEGGGVHFRKGSGTITNSTISYNTATGVGGVGMDDPNGTLTIKNTIIANNIRRNSSYYIDFGFRQSGNGNVVDNGYNIIGVSQHYTWEGTDDWTDVNRDETFAKYGDVTTGTLEMETSLAYNGNPNGTRTLSIASDSIAVDRGNTDDNGTVSVPTEDQRDFVREATPDIGSFEYLSPITDTTAPVISSVSATPSTTTGVINWSTDEESSSQVKYDPNQLHTTQTGITNSSTGVTSHEITLTGLVSCTKYYYSVSSSDSSGNTSTSSESNFITTGCTGDTTASNVSETTALPEYGGSINQTEGNLGITLTIPDGFAEDPAEFQLKGLDSEGVLNSVSQPTGYSSIGDHVFDVKALDTPVSTIDEFEESVEVSMTYTDEEISGLEESTLKIYRYHDSEWIELSNCTVDTDANTVTCTTTAFSILGLFGEVIAYEFTYIAGTNGSITGDIEQEVNVGEDGTAVTAVPETGYTFVSWSDDSTDNPRTDTNASEDVSITATFEADQAGSGFPLGRTPQSSDTDEEVGTESDPSPDSNSTDTEIDSTIDQKTPQQAGTKHNFIDIDGHWAEEYINHLYEEGVVSGYNENLFGPDNPITRAQFTKMVTEIMDYELVEEIDEPLFIDLEDTDWYTPYIEAAKNNGIIDGYKDGTFKPNNSINRAEAMKIVISTIYQGQFPEFESTFVDVLSTDWFAPYVIFAFKNGIITGYDENSFKPAKNMTRAEAAKVISIIKTLNNQTEI